MARAAGVLLAFAASSAAGAAADAVLQQDAQVAPHRLVRLHEAARTRGAVCLDGSPGAYYFRPGKPSASSKWYVHLLGGAWCTSLDDCLERSKGWLGSSTSYTEELDANYNAMSQEPSVNPVMHDWNSVIVSYCDGGSFTGTKSDPVEHNGTLLHFRGKAVLDAVREDLLKRGMANATEVVFSGCSAGGLASLLHLDSWADALRRSCPRLTRVTGLPFSGFFLEDEGPVKYESGLRWVFENMHSAGSLNPACLAAHEATGDPWRCIFAEHALPHTRTDLFLLQSAYDWWQLENILGTEEVDAVNAFGRRMRGLVHSGIRASNTASGVFLDSCKFHCQSWGQALVGGRSGAQAFEDWYTGRPVPQAAPGIFEERQQFPCRSCCRGEPSRGFPPKTPAPSTSLAPGDGHRRLLAGSAQPPTVMV